MAVFINREHQTFKSFIKDARKCKPITKEEERELLAIAHGEGEAAIEARNKLAVANILYLTSKANAISADGNVCDLVGDGFLGLVEAIKRFDLSSEMRLLTYATMWIEKNMRLANTGNSTLMSVPEDLFKVRSKVRKASSEFERKYGYEPTAQDLAEILGMSEGRIRATLNCTTGLSMDARFDDDDDRTYGDTFSSGDTYYADREVQRNQEKALVHDALKGLTEHERKVIGMHYGIDDGIDLSMTEIATRLGVSHESVRKTVIRAEAKLKMQLAPYRHAIAS